MDDLRQFLSRDEHLAPAGFVTRVWSGCRWAGIETVDDLRENYWLLRGVGRACVAHLEHLFRKEQFKAERDQWLEET